MEIPKNWTFKNENIAKNFDVHVREQLPFYDLVTDSIAHIARHYLPIGGTFYDIGAATGNLGLKLKNTLHDRNIKIFAIDNSKEMCDISAYKGIGEIICKDAENIHYEKFDVAIVFLALVFIQPSKQIKLINNLKKCANRGGCIILCERFLPEISYIGIVNQRLSLLGKLNNHVPAKEIIEKELSLSGIQRPLDYKKIKNLGFIDFFQLGDFRGMIFEK